MQACILFGLHYIQHERVLYIKSEKDLKSLMNSLSPVLNIWELVDWWELCFEEGGIGCYGAPPPSPAPLHTLAAPLVAAPMAADPLANSVEDHCHLFKSF